ncbi:hypothetical protein J5N97_020045 [Dioscorea zingiberensis]|uniref:Uncharacterized protein n=1 Tax=Dioscorea zingiberensis TaxID=325984 RepID=A0A9D5CF48_9LILI|nr:hypothetical protein J5N97_020045 [Dioscorea zingiberensis]
MTTNPLILLLISSLLTSTSTESTKSKSTSIVFTTLGRSRYNFDIFSTPLPLTSPPSSHQLTDGISVNFNGFFLPDSSLLFVSERNSTSNIYVLPSPSSSSSSRRSTLQLLLPSPLLASHLSFRDRPIISGDHLLYVSTHQPSSIPRQSWSAVYSTHLPSSSTLRLTPPGVADFSPSVSPSGLWTAVTSSGSRPWSGEVQDLLTDIYLFKTLDGSSRTFLLHHAAWPSWSDDSTLFFHRRSSDGWWSIYRATLIVPSSSPPSVSSVRRVTPPGFHAFTPAASPASPQTLAVATRRSSSQYRHIELIDLSEDGVAVAYHEVTRLISPYAHHFNPFISPDGSRIGYHRCRGGGDNGESSRILENIKSPNPDDFSLFRIDGSFPSFSPSGDRIAYVGLPGLFVMNSDGSGAPIKVFSGNAFATAWDWKRPGVIYTSYGPEFATESTRVDIISLTLDKDDPSSPPEIKKLTKGGENNAFPSPSPDGKWVVFRSGRDTHKNLYIMDAEQGESAELRRLTEGAWTDTMCNWSPDGEWIAFASDRQNPGSGSFAIYMIHPNGTGLRKVVESGDGGRTNHPWFSPDSKRLVFTSDYAGVSAEPVGNPHHYQPYGDIFTVGIDGSDIRRLTHNSYEDGTPTWAPIFLEPADVAENLGDGERCGFDDCHWLSVDNHQVLSSTTTC